MYVSKCCFLLLVSYFVLQWCCTVTCDCIPPEEPIKCSSGDSNCTITNSQGEFPDRSVCRAADAVYPTTEAELISAVATATMKKRKMKVYIYIYVCQYYWFVIQIYQYNKQSMHWTYKAITCQISKKKKLAFFRNP